VVSPPSRSAKALLGDPAAQKQEDVRITTALRASLATAIIIDVFNL
jgi:hypothetical protein